MVLKDVVCKLIEDEVIKKLDSHHIQLLEEYLPGTIERTIENEVNITIGKIVRFLSIEGKVLEDEDYENGEGDDH